MKSNRFFILPYTLPPDHIPHFMGRIVLDPVNPLRRFIPDPDGPEGFNPEDIVPNICRDPVPYQDCSEIVRAASSAKLRARLATFLGLESAFSGSESVQLDGQNVKRYEMVNHVLAFRKFMQDDRYAKQIAELLDESKNGQALMVVRFYTTEKSQWATSTGKARENAVDVQVPVGAIAGLPVALDPAVGVSESASVDHNMKGKVEIEEIFAVAYDVVKKKGAIDRNAKGWRSSAPVLGDEKRVKAGHLAMNDGDSDEELEFEAEGETEDDTTPIILDQESYPEIGEADTQNGYVDL